MKYLYDFCQNTPDKPKPFSAAIIRKRGHSFLPLKLGTFLKSLAIAAYQRTFLNHELTAGHVTNIHKKIKNKLEK